MAFIFQRKPVAVIKAKAVDSNTTYTINGVTTDVTTPDAAAEQINKIYSIVDKTVGAKDMIHLEQQEAVDNG